jgi:hypothetical protein
MPPTYPDIHVEITGYDQGAYGPLAQCMAAMARAGVPCTEQDRFTREATAGDYQELLRVAAAWLAVTD